jgi:hypothetical protein
MKQKSFSNSLHILTLFIISSMVFGLYISLAVQNHFPYMEAMLNGTAPRPYAYRIFAPFVIKALSSATQMQPYTSALLVMYISLIGFSWYMQDLAKTFLPAQYARIFAFFAPIGLIPFLIEQRHIYDFPNIFIFTLALYFLAKNDFNKYLLIFIVATLSKETSLFLILFFILQFRGIDRNKFKFLIFAQTAIYTAIRLFLIILFRNNPGGMVRFHLYDHFEAYRQNPAGAVFLFCIISAFILGVINQTDDKFNFARNSFIAIGIPSLFLYFLFGMPFEIRIFMETYPSIFLLTALMAARAISVRSSVGNQNRQSD